MAKSKSHEAIGIVVFTIVFAIGYWLAGCEMGPFHCDGEIPGQGPRCYCDADGLLCGHDGFGACSECPTP